MVKTPILMAAIFLVFASPFAVWAADDNGKYGHQPLQKSESLTFEAVFRKTLERSPDSLATPVGEEQAQRHAALGRSWMAGRPSLELNYVDDSPMDDTGLREIEGGIQLPLWRPGEKRNARRLGEAYQNAADSWKEYLKLSVAGRLRQSLTEIERAETILNLERQSTRDAEQLLSTTQALFNAGSVPRLDVMQAENLLLAQRKVTLRAEAMLVDAEREYAILTGLDTRPAGPYREKQSAGNEIEPDHPVLRYLRSQAAIAESAVNRAERLAKGSPTLSLGVRREQGSYMEPEVDSFGLGLSIPFGGGAFVSAAGSDARREQVNAEVRWQKTWRELNRQLHEVEHELFLTAESLKLSKEQARLGGQRYEMARTAFETGETTLTEVLRALREYRDSEKEFQTLQVRRQALITEYNQTIGVLP